MSVKKWSVAFGIIVILSMVLSACAAPPPTTVEKVVTQIVTQKVEVVQTQVVEKKRSSRRRADRGRDPRAGSPAQGFFASSGAYPDVIDPQKSSFVNEIGHLSMIYEGLTKERKPGTVRHGREVDI